MSRPADGYDMAVAEGNAICRLSQLAAMRRDLRHRLSILGLSPNRLDEALVAATELVANALIHTGKPATVGIDLEDAAVRVWVLDEGSPLRQIEPADPRRIGGNGLRLVDALCDDWGSDPCDEGGKRVWFTIRLAE